MTKDDRSPLASISFRPIQPDDRPFLAALYAGTREDELAQTDWDEDQKRDFLRQQFEAQYKFYGEQFPEGDFRIVLRAGRPVGRLYLDRRREEIRLVDIALLPECRNSGIGGALMQEVLDEAAQAGKPVRIHVECYNPALRLYKRLGFKHVDDNGVYFLMEWTP